MHTKLAVTLLTLILCLTSCNEENGKIQALQDEIKAVEEKEFKSRQELSRLKGQVNSIEADRDKLKEDKARLEADVEAAKKGLDAMKKQFEEYKSQYKVSARKNAPGKSLGDMVVDGRSYKNVKIREVQDDGIYIGHEGGLTNFQWSQLPEALQFTLAHRDPSPIIETKEAMTYNTAQTVTGPQKKPSREEHEKSVAEYDAKMSEIETQTKEHNKEILELKKELSQNQSARSQAARKNLPTVDIELAINACQVKITQLDTELTFLEKKKRELLGQDPRKKRYIP
jgi:chromosome segregation ATPase